MLVFNLHSIHVDHRQFVLLVVTFICYIFCCDGHHLVKLSILLVLLHFIVLLLQCYILLKLYACLKRNHVPF